MHATTGLCASNFGTLRTVQLTGNVACTRMMRVTCAQVTRVDAARLQ